MNPAVALSTLPAKSPATGVSANYVIPNSGQSGNFDDQTDSQQTEMLTDFPADMLLSSVLAESAEIPVSDELLSQKPVTEFPVLSEGAETQTEITFHPLNMVESKVDIPTVLPVTDSEEVLTGSSLAPATVNNTAAVVVQPVQGNGGMTVAQRWQSEQAAVLTGAVTAPQSQTLQPAQTLPVLSLQQFLQQWQSPVKTTVTTGITEAVATTNSNHQSLQSATTTTFQWKAESLGQQSASWGQKLLHLLSDKVHLQLGQQIQRAQIRLDPPHLGAIDLSVTVEGDRTTVQLYASSQQVRDAMQQHLDQLRQTLSQRMGEDMGIEVSVRQQNEQQEDKSFAGSDKIEQQHEIAAMTTETTQVGNKQHSGWLNRLV